MPLSWNEIRDRAQHCAREWTHTEREDAEGKRFLDGIFEVFGLQRRKVASFERRVKRLDPRDGYIDLLWKGTLPVEQKSRGKNLAPAYRQAIDYFPGLSDDGLPRYIASQRLLTLRAARPGRGPRPPLRAERPAAQDSPVPLHRRLPKAAGAR